MGLEDIFDFDHRTYRTKVQTLSHAELRKREIIKHRQQLTACGSMGAGIGEAIFTCGFSLIGFYDGQRRHEIAVQKLTIVHAELKKRDIKLYQPTKRDFVIPLCVVIVTAGIGVGTTLACLDVTSIGTADAFSDHAASAAAEQIISQPDNMAHDIVNGIEGQVEQVASLGTDHAADAVNAGNHAIFESFNAGFDPTGTAMGMHIAQAGEIAALQAATEPAAYTFRRKPVPSSSPAKSTESVVDSAPDLKSPIKLVDGNA